MNTIIVPVDFSSNAENAFIYALEINRKFKSKIILFHAFLVHVNAANLEISGPDENKIKKISFSSLKNFKENIINNNTDLNSEIELIVSSGYFNLELTELVNKKNADMIVMGTKGASGLKEVFIGSNTADLFEKTDCPVLAVPSEAKFKGIKKIVFATNYNESDIKNILVVIDFAKQFNSEVILLHITAGDISKSFEFNLIQQFSQRIKEECDFKNINFKLLDIKNIEEGIINYLDEVNADLVAITTRHRSLFQKLFDRSLTRKISFHTHIPLLVFHVKEKGNYIL